MRDSAERPACLSDIFDGVSVLGYEDMAALMTAYAEPDYMAILGPDEVRFNRHDNMMVAIGERALPAARRKPSNASGLVTSFTG